MALFRFLTRTAERDRLMDASRMERLGVVLDALRAEIENERNGLRNRYERVTADAAFSQQALEDGRTGPDLPSRIKELTQAMQRCAQRLAELDRQIAYIADMRDLAEAFPHGCGDAATSGPGEPPQAD